MAHQQRTTVLEAALAAQAKTANDTVEFARSLQVRVASTWRTQGPELRLRPA